jgi:predicted phosphate transport protein (TIGR00153 family)
MVSARPRGVQDLILLVLPKEDHFFDFLEKQATLAHDGAQALSKLDGDEVKAVKEAVHKIEKAGDKVSPELEDALARTFVTPLDREDIHRLSTLLDDILDRAYGTASAFDMFSIKEPSDAAKQLMVLLEKCTKQLAEMLPHLRTHGWDALREGTRAMKVLEKEGDEIYRETMRGLFADETLSARALIREKEVVEILEDAIDTCEDVAEYLTNLAVKHG